MRISAIQLSTYRYYNQSNKDRTTAVVPISGTFCGIANSGPLRKLFKYELPCMYRNVITIDPRQVHKLIGSGIFSKKSFLSIPVLSAFEPKILDVEKRVYRVLKAQSKAHPEKDLQEILDSLSPKYEKRLREKQNPIFSELDEYAENLPPEYKENYAKLMVRTRKKLNNEPIPDEFSKEEFMYKLQKIKGDVGNIKNPKAVKVVEKLMQEAEKFPETNTPENEQVQKDIMVFLNKILSKSVLKKYVPLKNLFASTQSKINKELILVPFSRKSFIHNLSVLLYGCPNEELRTQMINKARELPTSRTSIAAYIVKFSKEPSDKIAYRLLSPTFASIEHILPQANGGADEMANFAVATRRENSDRGNIDFTEQIKRKPGTKRYSQRLMNRYIELFKQGIFGKCGIKESYIDDFKNTIYVQSNGQINLSTRNLKKK